MATPKSPGDTLPCDYCNHHIAVIFCLADSAKLCLFCDQHVHAANALSGKHHRSQICDGCRSAPVSVRCSTDNLVFCRECDWDAHGSCSVSAAHDRTPIEGFTGCPTPFELASNWGFHLTRFNKEPFINNPGHDPDSWMKDLMVPDENETNYKKMNLNCGKQKNVILMQLSELYKRSLLLYNNGVNESRQQDDDDYDEVENEHQPFTSLLMMQGSFDVDLLKVRNSEQNIMRETKPIENRGTQIWDFNMGRLASPEESDAVDTAGYGTNNEGFMMKTFSEILSEATLPNKTELGEIYGINYPTSSHTDITSLNLQIQSNPNDRKATSSFGTLNGYGAGGGLNDIQFAEQNVMEGEKQATPLTKADLELLAKNRGDAMIRYKEKKKNRKYFSIVYALLFYGVFGFVI